MPLPVRQPQGLASAERLAWSRPPNSRRLSGDLLIQSRKVTLRNLLAQLDIEIDDAAVAAPDAVAGVSPDAPLGEQLRRDRCAGGF